MPGHFGVAISGRLEQSRDLEASMDFDLRDYHELPCPDCGRSIFAERVPDSTKWRFASCRCDISDFMIPHGSLLFGIAQAPLFVFAPNTSGGTKATVGNSG